MTLKNLPQNSRNEQGCPLVRYYFNTKKVVSVEEGWREIPALIENVHSL